MPESAVAPDRRGQMPWLLAVLPQPLYLRWSQMAAWACEWLPLSWCLGLAQWLRPRACADVCQHLAVEQVAALGSELPAPFLADVTSHLPAPLARSLLIYLPAPKLREVMTVFLGRGARRLAALVADAIAVRLANAIKRR